MTIAFDDYARQRWDSVAATLNTMSEITKDMTYYILNREGRRMEGMEVKLDNAIRKEWKAQNNQ